MPLQASPPPWAWHSLHGAAPLPAPPLSHSYLALSLHPALPSEIGFLSSCPSSPQTFLLPSFLLPVLQALASYLLLPQPSPGPGRVFSALLVSHVVSALSAPPLEGTHQVLPVAAPPQGVESQREDTWHGTGLGQGSSASGHIWGWVVVLRRGEGLSHTLLDVEQHPRRLLTKTPVALPSPSCVNQKCLQTLAGVSRGAAFLLVENCWVRR